MYPSIARMVCILCIFCRPSVLRFCLRLASFKQQYISRLSKTCVYKAGHGVSSCSLWSMPSEHGASSWGIIMGHLYRFMGHHHLEHEHAQANAACNNATSNCSSERPSHVVFHAAHYFGHYFGRFFHAGHQSIVTSMQPLRASSFGA